jgi:hypothetical protein
MKKKGDETELEWLEEIRKRKLVCTCDVDPEWCEVHNDFA